MLIEGYMVVFVEIYIHFRVICSLENCHRLYFNIAENYVYYEFIRLYFLYSYIKEVYDYIY